MTSGQGVDGRGSPRDPLSGNMWRMLLSLVLAAAPVVLPPPSPAAFPESLAAACTGDGAVRICKAVPSVEGSRPGLVVDGPGERHVEWDATALPGDLDDFQALTVDLDGDGQDELIVANRAAEATGVSVRLWELAIVEGGGDGVTHALVHDWGPDAVDAQGRLLLTEWEWRGQDPAGLVFTGREYTWRGGRLWPTKAPVLRRTLDAAFEAERARTSELVLAPRQALASPTTRRSADPTPGRTVSARVLGISREEPFLSLHVQRSDGSLDTLSQLPDARPLLRMGDARSGRLYPMGYAPAAVEDWLVGRAVRLVVDGERVAGPVWVN